MVEVPALLYQLDALLERVDFLSVGSLTTSPSFLFAADRGNPRVNTRFDELSVPMLRASSKRSSTPALLTASR